MSIDRIVMMFAGAVILVSLLLSQLHHVYWLFLTAFVGANLLQASVTGFCPLAKLLKALGRLGREGNFHRFCHFSYPYSFNSKTGYPRQPVYSFGLVQPD